MATFKVAKKTTLNVKGPTAAQRAAQLAEEAAAKAAQLKAIAIEKAKQTKLEGGNPPTGTGTHPVTTTTPTAPFLTASQQQQKDDDYNTYLQNLNTYNADISNAKTTETKNEATDNYNSKVSQVQANAMAAARGIMGSGINASDLADINTTLVNNLNTLRTGLATTIAGYNGQIGNANTGWNEEVAQYNDLAAQNAANAGPVTTTTQVPNPVVKAAPVVTNPGGVVVKKGVVTATMGTTGKQPVPKAPVVKMNPVQKPQPTKNKGGAAGGVIATGSGGFKTVKPGW